MDVDPQDSLFPDTAEQRVKMLSCGPEDHRAVHPTIQFPPEQPPGRGTSPTPDHDKDPLLDLRSRIQAS